MYFGQHELDALLFARSREHPHSLAVEPLRHSSKNRFTFSLAAWTALNGHVQPRDSDAANLSLNTFARWPPRSHLFFRSVLFVRSHFAVAVVITFAM